MRFHADYQRITTEAEYLSALVGKKVIVGDGGTISHPDGTMTGAIGGNEVNVNWTWEGKLFCREGTVGSDKVDRDCQTLEIAGNQVRSISNGGKGEENIYKFE